MAKAAYFAAWDSIPHPEVCAVVSDDAETILTLLLSGKALAPFTRERLDWYLRGRAPWGYEGTYPNGRWLVL